MARRRIEWGIPRRPPLRDPWDEYTSRHGWPEPRYRFYDLLEQDSGHVHEYWAGESEPRRVTRRRSLK
jgi:hypothetical protein